MRSTFGATLLVLQSYELISIVQKNAIGFVGKKAFFKYIEFLSNNNYEYVYLSR